MGNMVDIEPGVTAKRLTMTMEFDRAEVTDGLDTYMLDFLNNMFKDRTGRTKVELTDV